MAKTLWMADSARSDVHHAPGMPEGFQDLASYFRVHYVSTDEAPRRQ